MLMCRLRGKRGIKAEELTGKQKTFNRKLSGEGVEEYIIGRLKKFRVMAHKNQKPPKTLRRHDKHNMWILYKVKVVNSDMHSEHPSNMQGSTSRHTVLPSI